MIENHLERLTEIKGIGKKRIKQISQAWEQQKAIKEVMVFLQGHGVSTVYATKIYKCYGHEAIETVTNNPYKLAEDIYGIGFISADTIARNVGISPWSKFRYKAGILHTLTQATADGHFEFSRL
ncbi:helix-hairpin-helix domain-containing protein [Lyngbya sp. PCC 8106]|uniref:helix-hairpin-helix domain-containing protein n=1 Tax=Lyngbya sp. (strain PCC 8106) TaxID=313612 RepID=UPI0000EA8F6B|nr:helix-hairpin-helix domain-containing protein [Lyngbya sp. PCC 8106]EAW35092.1 exodeoxyribonuclease V, alpha chain [Lyngbya sp. PCC 8106]